MLAFKNKPELKQKFLDRVKEHRQADELIQGYGYWQDGKGCAVGCTLHIQDGGHKKYETTLGIPERLAYLEDAIFEGLPVEDARKWPERFLSAIEPGADLSLVWHQFAAWLLSDSELLTITEVNQEAIKTVLSLHVRACCGDQPSANEWSAAWSAAAAAESAWSESAAARSAAAAAARSAWSAAAAAAAWSAESAAWSAAESAAWSAAAAAAAAFQTMADKLIKLLKAAKAKK